MALKTSGIYKVILIFKRRKYANVRFVSHFLTYPNRAKQAGPEVKIEVASEMIRPKFTM